MNEFIELHAWGTHDPIFVRVAAIDCIRNSDTVDATVLTIGDKECEVSESYEKVKKLVMGQDIIEFKYDEVDQEQIEKWIDKLSSIGCTSFPISIDSYIPREIIHTPSGSDNIQGGVNDETGIGFHGSRVVF